MSRKNSKTTCEALSWKDMLYVVQCLKKDQDYKMALFIYTASNVGLRIGDLLTLTWKILNQKEFTITEGKTGKTRTITVNNNLQEMLEYSYSKLNPASLEDYIFCNPSGKPYTRQHINYLLHNIFEKYAIKIKNGSSHSLRKAWAKRVFEVNNKTEAALILISDILNHSSIACTRRYIGITQEIVSNVYLSI